MGADLALALADIASLAALLWIIQFYLQPPGITKPSFLPEAVAGNRSPGLIALFLALFTIKNLFAWLVARGWSRFAAGVALRVSRQNLVDYQQAGYDQFVQTDSSIHIRKIAFQPFEFCQYILTAIPLMATQIALILLSVAAILLFKPVLFLLLLAIILPPVIALFYIIRQRLHRSRETIRTSNENSLQYLLDALRGYVEGNIYGRNAFFRNRFLKARAEFGDAVFDSINIQTMPARIIELFAVLGLFLLIAFSTWKGGTDPNWFITIGAFMGAAYKIIPGVVKLINLGGQARAYSGVTDEILESQRSASRPPEGDSRSIESVSLEGIGFSYAGKKVLSDIQLQLVRGDFLVITGESGKGKTTLANLLTGLQDPATGQIRINGQPIAPGNMFQYWPAMAYVKQQPFLVHDTVLSNIVLGEEKIDEQRLRCALETSGLDVWMAGWPDGISHSITEQGKNLSGGQRQRIALARALYAQADLLILDEPFSELDPESENRILEHLQKLAGSGRMIVLITHHAGSRRFATQSIHLHER